MILYFHMLVVCLSTFLAIFFVQAASIDPESVIPVLSISCGTKGQRHVNAFITKLVDSGSRRLNVTILADDYNYKFYHKDEKVIKSKFYDLRFVDISSHIKNVSSLVQYQGYRLYPCANFKLDAPSFLSDELALYLDIDVLVMEDLHNLWKVWDKVPGKVWHLALEIQSNNSGWYYDRRFTKKHFMPPSGVNSGVILMNLTAMRELEMTGYSLIQADKEPNSLGDQDTVNTWCYFHQSMCGILDCPWNRRDDDLCYVDFVDLVYVGIIHGNGRRFIRNTYMSDENQRRIVNYFYNASERFFDIFQL